ncbi:indolepyruvate ferredoxin oxidoreductase family protein [Gammaproteobacteria bacterium]|nr:indolepyruvate ferredoxin oxidoreductase family protein [Gammaproteobacteria bacterium]
MEKKISLDDKYVKKTGRIYINGVQSLVRLPLIQKHRDLKKNLNTAGFISGYPGSPLGGYDLELIKAKKYLTENEIEHFQAINEEIAATSVWGSQQIEYKNKNKKDGVFGIWYGKGPGVDRSLDAFKHANAAGSSQHGGVLAIAGDDHGCKSSTIPHQSDHNFISAFIPYLYPAGIDDIISYGLLGFAISRYSGCWVGMKIVSDVAESAKTYDTSNENQKIIIPSNDELLEYADLNRNITFIETPRELDFKLQRVKGFAAQVFGHKNNIDQVKWPNINSKIGIISSGKSYNDVREALRWLGIDKVKAKELGICLYKIGMPWPLEPNGVRSFCEGLDKVLVVEEKRELIEHQIKWQLYNWNEKVRPEVTGKQDENGKWQLPPENDLPLATIVEVLANQIYKVTGASELLESLDWFKRRNLKKSFQQAPVDRKAYFCSGCPHNSSTMIPEGSSALAGIGCHYMAVNMDRNTDLYTQMGGEGTPWIGQSKYIEGEHIFANLGDGTYKHSGSLAIRACVDAKVNITFKILYNDAVAMTGGQVLGDNWSTVQIAKQVLSEGVNKVVILTENLKAYKNSILPKEVELKHRDHLQNIQKKLQLMTGVTVLIYDQGCAAEKRRKRKRGIIEDPLQKILINPEVCEGCGDCSVQSNCMSVEPLDTKLGRKRKINQSTCNKDYSCIKGFCPSFFSIESDDIKHIQKPLLEFNLPDPKKIINEEITNIILTGIGGTGVLTISAILGMAANIENKKATTLDMTGLSQKGGAVWAYIKLYTDKKKPYSHKITPGMSDVLLACDQVVATKDEIQEVLSTKRTYAVINSNSAPVADFIKNTDIDFKADEVRELIKNTTKEIAVELDSIQLSYKFFGNTINANMIQLGAAYQAGLIPLKDKSIIGSINLNKWGAENNIKAFNLGRLLIHNPNNPIFIENKNPVKQITIDELQEEIANYSKESIKDFIRIKSTLDKKYSLDEKISVETLREYGRICLIKDEYRVASMHLKNYKKIVNEEFSSWNKLSFYLAPPILSFIKDKKTNNPKKFKIPGYVAIPLFFILNKLSFLRGTLLDVFRFSKERQNDYEHKRIFEERFFDIVENSKQESELFHLIEASKKVKGYGSIRERNLNIFKENLQNAAINFTKI